ncbi:thioredoxin [Micromonospora qiuiae]|uniref:Thioredoxin n=2 Tax=Micromonospora qiuiae TaxID=502268 RepID=A0ABQ4J6K2_9ACTN|nr:thioredoxin [Micromonospora qiuiae]
MFRVIGEIRMATVELTTANFDQVTESDGIVLVDFWADWCGPCKRFAPVYERSSEKHSDITFGKVDTEAQQELAAKFEIRSIPTIMAIRDGVIVFAQPGALPESALENLIEQVRGLDMDDVRKKLAEHKH